MGSSKLTYGYIIGFLGKWKVREKNKVGCEPILWPVIFTLSVDKPCLSMAVITFFDKRTLSVDKPDLSKCNLLYLSRAFFPADLIM